MTMKAHVANAGDAGDGLFASETLGPGELVLSLDRPYLTALDTSQIIHACSNCLSTTINSPNSADIRTPPKCAGCQTLRFCSKKCQAASWKRLHKYECKLLGRLKEKGQLPNAALIVLQMIYLVAATQENPFEHLKSHFDDMSRVGGERFESMKLLAYGLHQYSGKQLRLDTVQNFFSLVFTNALTITSSSFDILGLCIDPVVSMINHSCDPNCFVVFDGARLDVRTLRPLQKDEEITMSYIDATAPYHRRQKQLLDQYYFTCRCDKCLLGPTTAADLFLQDTTALPDGWDSKVDSPPQPKENASPPSDEDQDYLGPSEVDGLLSRLQARAYSALDLSKKDKNPETALSTIRGGIADCTNTGIWPEHRQPLASLRHEEFLRLLEMQDWATAFRVGLKLRSEIQPNLYPQHFYPLRVIHTYTLARLATYLASMPSEMSHTDAQMLLLGFVSEVVNDVESSHGKGSSFAKDVYAKGEGLRIYVESKDPAATKNIADALEYQVKLLR